jgi:hypothetical protein
MELSLRRTWRAMVTGDARSGHNRRHVARMAVAGVLLATAAVAVTARPASADPCNQSSHVWVATPSGSLANGNTVVVGHSWSVWVTGVVSSGTGIAWQFIQIGDPPIFNQPYNTRSANGNCVVNQEQVSVASIGPVGSRINVEATYTDWETHQLGQHFVGYLLIGS